MRVDEGVDGAAHVDASSKDVVGVPELDRLQEVVGGAGPARGSATGGRLLRFSGGDDEFKGFGVKGNHASKRNSNGANGVGLFSESASRKAVGEFGQAASDGSKGVVGVGAVLLHHHLKKIPESL